MSSESSPIAALVWTFGLMSLFAVGGANSAIPEMHRAAVDVHHWLTDKQFTDVYSLVEQNYAEPIAGDKFLLGCSLSRLLTDREMSILLGNRR